MRPPAERNRRIRFPLPAFSSRDAHWDFVQNITNDLVEAVINGDLHSLQRIIEERRFRGVFDINARWNDWTLLTLAAREDRREIARCLLGNGADANVTCKNGWTALMGAATNSSIQMTRLLVGNGAKVNMTDDGGITALMQAALNGNLEVVKLLLERDANINAVARDGQTALENTIPNNNIEIAKYLVNKGAELGPVRYRTMPRDFKELFDSVEIARKLVDTARPALERLRRDMRYPNRVTH